MTMAPAKLGIAAMLFAAVLPAAIGQETTEHGVLLTGDALRNALVGKYNPGDEGIEAFCKDGRWYRGGRDLSAGRYELKFDQYCVYQGGAVEPWCSFLFARPDGKFESRYVSMKTNSYTLLDLRDLRDPRQQVC